MTAALLLLSQAQTTLALGVLALLWAVFFWPTRLEVNASELKISWLGWRTVVPYADLASTTVYFTGGIPFGVAVSLRNGKVIRIPVFRPALHRQRQILRSVLGTIAAAQTKAGFAATPNEVLSMPPSSSQRQ